MDGFELGTDRPPLILAAVDGTVTSLRAGAYAAGPARRQGSQPAVITVTGRDVAGDGRPVNETHDQRDRIRLRGPRSRVSSR